MNAREKNERIVYLVGAGPGDPELMTIRAFRILQRADCVLYDSLLEPSILELTSPDCERIFVGKRKGQHSMRQHEINELLLAHATPGRVVVRLKGGDPFIFGRGGEELDFLRRHGVRIQVVPGVTTASAASAELQIPLTHRYLGRSVMFITGYSRAGRGTDSFPDYDWKYFAAEGFTLVIYMGLHHLSRIASTLIEAGRAEDTPTAVISNCTLREQEVHVTRLGDLSALAESGRVVFPAVVIIGEVVGMFSRDAAELDHSGAALPREVVAGLAAARETILEQFPHERDQS